MFIDSHCHLNMDKFTLDYKEVIKRAFNNNIGAIINVGADLVSSKKAIEIANEYEKGIYATVGLHPGDAKDEVLDEAQITELANYKRVVAIGEIGLDYSGENIDKDAQLKLMDRQVQIAQKLQKPIVFHCRDAYDDLISYFGSHSSKISAVVHCYTGDWEHAQKFLELGFYLSFTGIITFTKDEEQIKVVRNTPLNRILIETDAPWLAPEPYRGKRNEPSYVIEAAKKIAEIKGISLEEVASQTTKNAIDLFKLPL